nr:alkaline phosphatase [Gammaproteobacteria bacterium]
MNKFFYSALTASMFVLTGCTDDDDNSPVQPADEAVTSLSSQQLETSLTNPWFQQGQQDIEAAKAAWAEVTGTVAPVTQSGSLQAAIADARGKAKNVILFVGDGMGVSTVTAARILDGQNQGKPGEEHQLSFERFPFAGLAKTYNVDAQVPDSAGTMTAMVSGVKTDVGVLGVDEDVSRGDCGSATGNELMTLTELAELAGKATGVVSTARITHATPAATYAKSADRNWEDISDMPPEAVTDGCQDIADQLVNFEANLEARTGADIDGLDVVMGGGRRHFLPNDARFNSPDARSSVEGDRTDGRNLVTEWQAQYPQG